jgi:DNA transposition AAA+ family ATPase
LEIFLTTNLKIIPNFVKQIIHQLIQFADEFMEDPFTCRNYAYIVIKYSDVIRSYYRHL